MSFCTKSIASTSRLLPFTGLGAAAFSTSVVIGAGKGKAPAKAPQKRRQVAGFGKKGSGSKAKVGRTDVTTTANLKIDLNDPAFETLRSQTPEFELTATKEPGNVIRFNTFERLRAFGLPKKIETDFARGYPASIIRQSTDKLITRLSSIKGDRSSSEGNRILLSGSRGSGKSMIMYQAISAALLEDWVVIYIPRASQLTNSSSAYTYNPSTQIFDQPTLSSSLLSSISSANSSILQKIELSQDYDISGASGGKLGKGMNLSEVVAMGVKDEGVAVRVLEVVMEVLAGQKEYPVLLAIDEVQSFFSPSLYRTPTFTCLQSYSLSLPKLLLSFISNTHTLTSGAILTSTSASSTSNPIPREMIAAIPTLPRGKLGEVGPYEQLDEWHVQNAGGLKEVMDVGERVDLREARGILSLCEFRKFTFGKTDEALLGKLAESGGNINELVRGLTRTLAV